SDAVKIARVRFNGVNQKHVGTKQAETAEILDGRTASRHDVDTPLAMSLREWSGAILYKQSLVAGLCDMRCHAQSVVPGVVAHAFIKPLRNGVRRMGRDAN